MYCSKCGTQINEKANFCQKCGVAVAKFSPQTSEAPQVNAPSAPYVHPLLNAKHNIFTYISAGITAFMILLLFLPWLTDPTGRGYSMLTVFTNLVDIHEYDGFCFIFCTFLFIPSIIMLVISLIFILTRKNSVSKGLPIATCADIFFNLIIFTLFDVVTKQLTFTAVPVLMFISAVGVIICIDLAKKHKS